LAKSLSELKMRYFNRAVLRYPPGKFVFDFTRWHVLGVTPKVTFTVNALGLRGPMPPQVGKVYRIITIGGSTTECIAQDDAQEWPHLLMVELNQRQKGLPVWVGNAGVSGLTTVTHASCLRRLPVLHQADLLIFLIGVNDLAAALLFDGAPTQEVLEERAELFAEHAPTGFLMCADCCGTESALFGRCGISRYRPRLCLRSRTRARHGGIQPSIACGLSRGPIRMLRYGCRHTQGHLSLL
jgi:hypothetical protein